MDKELFESLAAILRRQPREKLKLKPFSFDGDTYKSVELIHYSADTLPPTIIFWSTDSLNCRGIEDFPEELIKKSLENLKKS